MNDIYNSKSQKLKENMSTDGKLSNVDVNGKDTIEVLNNLVEKGEFLSEVFQKKMKKVNSLSSVHKNTLPHTTFIEILLT